MSNPSLLILPGDGIGPEVMQEVRKVISWFGDKRDLAFDVSEDLVGGAAYDKHGTPLHDDTMKKAAKRRNNKVCSMEKANVMESGILWRKVVQKIHDEEYPDVELSHMYADNGAMQLVRWPKQFDVIVTDNLFGDILSDCAAMLTGSLGMLPSASLGAPRDWRMRLKRF